jgi:hypothetical protein
MEGAGAGTPAAVLAGAGCGIAFVLLEILMVRRGVREGRDLPPQIHALTTSDGERSVRV